MHNVIHDYFTQALPIQMRDKVIDLPSLNANSKEQCHNYWRRDKNEVFK